MEDVTAFVLVGGKSSRMGRDKAYLELGGRTMLSRAIHVAAAVAGTVKIVGSFDRFRMFGLVVEDQYHERGPLGGIHAALKSSSTPLNLMLAVDLPFIDERFLTHLLSVAQRSTAIVTVPRSEGGWQPLCAVYRLEFGEIAEKALLEGKNRIDRLFGQVEVRAIEEQELVAWGCRENIFRNLNTPEDWKVAEKELKDLDATKVERRDHQEPYDK